MVSRPPLYVCLSFAWWDDMVNRGVPETDAVLDLFARVGVLEQEYDDAHGYWRVTLGAAGEGEHWICVRDGVAWLEPVRVRQ